MDRGMAASALVPPGAHCCSGGFTGTRRLERRLACLLPLPCATARSAKRISFYFYMKLPLACSREALLRRVRGGHRRSQLRLRLSLSLKRAASFAPRCALPQVRDHYMTTTGLGAIVWFFSMEATLFSGYSVSG